TAAPFAATAALEEPLHLLGHRLVLVHLFAHLGGVRLEVTARRAAQAVGHHDPDGDHLLAVADLAQPRHPLAAEPELGARLGARRQFDGLLAVERGYGEARAERRLRHPDLEPEVEVVAGALQERMRLHLDVEVEVAGGSAVHTGVPLARHAQAVTAVDAARQRHLDAVLRYLAAAAVADLARGGDDLAVTVTVGAGTRGDDGAEDR